ncbi:heavy metal translocating P-type ATPase [Peptacetobacter sp.]|uniref:heavy metal translocating P-type ATPase n=1 Tax=Peptacetobacter sp. TaxID=2991975 RepID=UPI00260542D1|nr:heavy metal translocating P-type ATPase [Peptacetobacter sp.]
MSTRIDFLLEGLNCAHCAEKINDKVSKLDYVENSNMNFVAKKLSVFMENESITEANVSKIAKIIHDTESGLTVSLLKNKVLGEISFDNKGNIIKSEKKDEIDKNKVIRVDFLLNNLNCAHCAEKINDKVGKLAYVENSNMNFVAKKLSVFAKARDITKQHMSEIAKIIHETESGLTVSLLKNKVVGALDFDNKGNIVESGNTARRGRTDLNVLYANRNNSEEHHHEHGESCGCGEHHHDHDHGEECGCGEHHHHDHEHGEECGCGERHHHDHEHDEECGCGGHHHDHDEHEEIKPKKVEKPKEKKEINKDLIKIIIGVFVYAFGIYEMAVGNTGTFGVVVFLAAYILIGGDVLLKAAKNLFRGQVMDENFLMSIATIGAIAIGEHSEAVGVMLFYKIGEYLQQKAVGQSRKSISALMEIKSEFANLVQGGKIIQVDPEEVEVGDVIVVKPGEKVPLDGIVTEGEAMLDTSAITGESVLRSVKPGEEVVSGTINTNALIHVRVTKEYGESTVAKILDMVENAVSRKSQTENFISRFCRYYTPIVVGLALAVAFIPPLVIEGAVFRDWLYRGLIFLVVSCPCALVLSIPLSFFGGIGSASKNGILIKGSNYLEALRKVDTVVLDKTGTITKGVFKVTEINPVGMSEDELLRFAAIAEANSNHPIAKSIMESYNEKFEEEVKLSEIDKYEEIAAHGIKVLYNGKTILAGSSKLLDSENVKYEKIDEVGTTVYVAVDGKYAGCIVISDQIKEDSKKAIAEMRKVGITNVVMLTGDNEAAAAKIAKEVGVDKYYSGLLPNQKVEMLEEIASKNSTGNTAFIGDGINDAPVLARADVGIAMGGVGSDAAIEASDIVFMTDELSKLPIAKRISEKTNKIVWQNIVFAMGVKVIVMLMSTGGVANMWEAIFADVGVALIAVLNAMRTLKE